jgi:CHAT domain-containing protein
MSVDEAKRVTASFGQAGFVPPPRTIDDITAILARERRENPEAVALARQRADAAVPATSDRPTLTDFYRQRSQAAGMIGRLGQQVEDLEAAVNYAAGDKRPSVGVQILYELASAEEFAGRFGPAEGHYEEAILKADPGDLVFRVILHYRLVALHRARRDREKAERALRAMNQIVPAASRALGPSERAQIAQAEGHVMFLSGRVRDAERSYRQAAAILEAEPTAARLDQLTVVLRVLTDTLIQQQRLVEAEVEIRRALLISLRQHGRYSQRTGERGVGLGLVLLEQGRYTEAEMLGRAVAEIFDRIGALRGGGRWVLARALAAQERWPEALAAYDHLDQRNAFGMDEGARRRYYSDPDRAIALLAARKFTDAAKMLEAAVVDKRDVFGDAHPVSAEYTALLGLAHAGAGQPDSALRTLRAAKPILVSREATATDEGGGGAGADRRLSFILSGYVTLLHDVWRGNPTADVAAEAFQIAEMIRGRSVDRALNATAARSAAATPALADLVRREQDASMQASAIYGHLANLLSVPAQQREESRIAQLRTQVGDLQRARQTIAAEINSKFPTYAELVSPSPATVDQMRTVLRSDETILSFLVTAERTFVWAIPKEGSVSFTAAPVGASKLAEMVIRLRKSLDPGARTVGDIPEFDIETAHELYQMLLEPVRPAWDHARTLLVVPHGPLGDLPLSLLPTKRASLPPDEAILFSRYRTMPWLARTHAVVVLPSAGALGTLRGMPAATGDRRPFAGFGDPYFNRGHAREAAASSQRVPGSVAVAGIPVQIRDARVPAQHSTRLSMLPRLPDTADEIRTIAAALNAVPERDIFLGERANEKTLMTLDLTRYRVIAFATHGLVPGDLDGLTQPALALTAPEVAGVDGDGLLTMDKILGLRLNADWVVLSACNTASGGGTRAEAFSGLGRAFFYAGARALLVSNWPVETTSARALTTEVFRRQAADPRLTRARALQEAMNALIDSGVYRDPTSQRIVFSYAHPIFWAPFTLVGDGG